MPPTERSGLAPPLVVARGGLDAVDGAVRAATARGWKLRHDWRLPVRTWDVRALRLVFVGTVATPEEEAAAVLAAARGAGVIVAVGDGGGVLERLVDDLSRIGDVTVEGTDHTVGLQALRPQERDVLELLADGATLAEAARALNFSTRTVARRLARARKSLGARTTAEALVYFRQKLE